MNDRTIEIENLGPIHRLSIPWPEGGGVVELLGDNGVGKTQATNAVAALLAGKGAVEMRRGSLGGSVIGLGAALSTGGSRTKRTGELVVHSFEGGGNPSAFIDPRIQDPAAADAVRLGELCSLLCVKPDRMAYAALVGGMAELERIARPASLLEDDATAMAKKLAADFQAEARSIESQEENARGRAHGLRQGLEETDLSGPHDAAQLAQTAQLCAKEVGKLEAEAQAMRTQALRAREATEHLKTATKEYKGLSVEKALAAAVKAGEDLTGATTARENARRAYDEACAEWKNADRANSEANSAVERAEAHERAISAWRETLSGPGAKITEASIKSKDADIATAKDALEEAQHRVEQGAVIRDGLKRKAEADEAAEKANELEAAAVRMRNAAAACWDVLSAAISKIAPMGLRVRDGRLTVPDGDGEKYFAELSDGQRAKIGIDIAIDSPQKPGYIPLHQWFWEGLAPKRRWEIREHARARGVTILAARADDNELRAVVMSNGEQAEEAEQPAKKTRKAKA